MSKTSDSIRTAISSGPPADLSVEIAVLLNRYQVALEASRIAEAQRVDIKEQLVAALGCSNWGMLPDGRAFGFRSQQVAGYTVQPKTKRLFFVCTPSELSAYMEGLVS